MMKSVGALPDLSSWLIVWTQDTYLHIELFKEPQHDSRYFGVLFGVYKPLYFNCVLKSWAIDLQEFSPRLSFPIIAS